MRLLALVLMLVATTGFAGARWELAPLDDIVNSSVGGVVRIEVAGLLGTRDFKEFGSGVVITPDGYVQTAAHLIPDTLKNVRISGVLAYESKTRDYSPKPNTLTVVSIDYGLDLALLKFERIPAGMRALPLNPIPPRNSERLTVLGFAAGSNFMTRDDIIFQGMGDDRLGIRFEYHGIVNPGNSGSPILNRSGFVVGLHLAQKKKVNGVEVSGMYLGSQTINFLLPDNWKVANTKPIFFPGTVQGSSNLTIENFNSDRWYPKDGDWTVERIDSLKTQYFTNRTSRRCEIAVPSDWTLGVNRSAGFILQPPGGSELGKYQFQLSQTIEKRQELKQQFERSQSGKYVHLPFGFLPGHNESIMLLRMRRVNEMGHQVEELVPFILHFHKSYYQIMKYFDLRNLPSNSGLDPEQNIFMARCNISNKAALSIVMDICEDFMRQVVPKYFVEDNKCVPGSSRW